MRQLLAGLLVVCCDSTARAELIAAWNFNDADLTVDHGSGTLTDNTDLSFGSPGTTIGAVLGDVSGDSLRIVNGNPLNNGKWLQVQVNLTGFYNPILSFASTRGPVGFNSNTVSWSTDNVNFSTSGIVGSANPYTPTDLPTFSLFTFNFDAANALDGISTAYFRITFDGATTGTGIARNNIDNIVVNASVPEPSSLCLLGCGAFVLAFARRRRTKAAPVVTP